ncbi:MAG TPA: crossover junction endodeoxyribonuclease RuvC, partial [Candidatus Hydrogenedentes bacterium]|nr:crossover junction endodeoxyribonuclease RuvC [Candidatus Hydrogenedentota bacterium]
MRAIGFDPGTATTGWGVVERVDGRLRHVAHGVITTGAREAMPLRLVHLYEGVTDLLTRFQPALACVERLFFKQNVTNGITVAQARGVILLAAARQGVIIGEFSPTEAKTAVTGYGRADKQQMQEMTRLLLGLEERPRPDDAADALALAICMLQNRAGLPSGPVRRGR